MVSAVAAACSGGGDAQEAGGAGKAARAPGARTQGGGNEAAGGGGGAGFATDALEQQSALETRSQLPAIGPNVIKTADVSVRVDDELESAIRRRACRSRRRAAASW
jgi:hypothetical protein